MGWAVDPEEASLNTGQPACPADFLHIKEQDRLKVGVESSPQLGNALATMGTAGLSWPKVGRGLTSWGSCVTRKTEGLMTPLGPSSGLGNPLAVVVTSALTELAYQKMGMKYLS